jgi:hypothetical protein
MSSTSRKWAGRAMQFALVLLALALAGNWVHRHFTRTRRNTHVSKLQTPPDSLGAGDLRILNADSSVDLVLAGNEIWAGLSPQTVAKVRRDIDSSQVADTGLGGSIAQLVKKTVAGAIGTHAVFRLSDLRDVHYDNGRLVFDWKTGAPHAMFDNTTIDGKHADESFRRGDAERFIDAVHARQKELGLP